MIPNTLPVVGECHIVLEPLWRLSAAQQTIAMVEFIGRPRVRFACPNCGTEQEHELIDMHGRRLVALCLECGQASHVLMVDEAGTMHMTLQEFQQIQEGNRDESTARRCIHIIF